MARMDRRNRTPGRSLHLTAPLFRFNLVRLRFSPERRRFGPWHPASITAARYFRASNTMARFNPFQEPWPRIIGIPLLALVLSFTFHTELPTALGFAITLGITALIWQGCYMIIGHYRQRFPGIERTGRRIMITVVALSAYIITVDITACTVLDALELEPSAYKTGEWRSNLIKCFGATLVVGTLYEAGYFFAMWKHQAIETEAIKSRQLRTELDMLKNQVSPHFLFNSLNTLVALIHEDADQAARFTKDLSHVYRYILQHKEKEVVDLGTELDFTQAYINLMKVRFAESLRINVDVAPEHRHLLIAPLTLQLLLENALKHNVASTAKPLQVDIHVEHGRTLVVRNSLHRKQGTVEGTGTGINNVKQRYAYLSEREVDVIETREHFLVALPLMQLAEHEARV
jgi:two-component system LytT family sensor kinase